MRHSREQIELGHIKKRFEPAEYRAEERERERPSYRKGRFIPACSLFTVDILSRELFWLTHFLGFVGFHYYRGLRFLLLF